MKKKISFKREFSAGAVVFKKQPDTRSPSSGSGNSTRLIQPCSKPDPSAGRQKPVKFLIGKHSGYHKWVLPKGLIEKGEKGYEAAIRETEEEMGVKAKLISQKPIYEEEYFFVADFKNKPDSSNQKPEASKKSNVATRRVAVYQEQRGGKVRVFKTVSFYLAEYESGDPKKHGWEMSEAGWFTYEEALEKMVFEGEKKALRKARKEILI